MKIKYIMLIVISWLLLFVVSIFILIVVVCLAIYDLFTGKKMVSILNSMIDP